MVGYTVKQKTNGKLSSAITLKEDGSTIVQKYSEQTGAVTEETTIDAIGNYVTSYFDEAGTKILATLGFDAQGNIVKQKVAPDITYAQFGQTALTALGDQLIASLAFKNNLPAALAAQTLNDAIVQQIFADPANQIAIKDFTRAGAEALAENFGAAVATRWLESFVLPKLGADVAKAIGLPSSYGSTVVSILESGSPARFIGATLGKDLSKWAIGAATVGSSIGSAVGTALGIAFSGTIATEIGALIGSAFTPLGTIIGAAIGSFIGSLVGSLFGGHQSVGPNAIAGMDFDPSTQRFIPLAGSADNGGSAEAAAAMVKTAASALNAILQAIGGQVVSPVQHSNLGYIGGHYFFVFGITNGPQNSFPDQFSTADLAIDFSVLTLLRAMIFQGGDPFLLAALSHSSATTLQALSAELDAARIYEAYTVDPIGASAAIVLSGDESRYQNLQTSIAFATNLGLDRLTALTGGGYVWTGTASQLSNDLTMLQKITGQLTVNLDGGGTEVASVVDSLQWLSTHVGSLRIVIQQNGNLPLTTAQILRDSQALRVMGNVAGDHKIGIEIQDVPGDASRVALIGFLANLGRVDGFDK